ncbi:uncharacterized protein [Miscanthus floridulus]|uniref:uncharacterized protein n=1 Tax=Miscanthus floridulus TaxID=154761 RepID=UPI00345B1E12
MKAIAGSAGYASAYLAYPVALPLDPRDSGFDLNVRLEEDNNGNFAFDLNEPILEDHNDSGNVSTFSEFVVSFLTGFDLKLTLDEYGAVDFDYVQNLPEHAVESPVEVNHRRKDMIEEVTKQVYQALLATSKNGTLGKKDTRIVADQFGVHIRSVQRLWKRGKNQLAHNIPVVVHSQKKGRCGRKAVPLDLEQLRNIPLKQRMTIEDVSSKLGISKSRIQRYLKKCLLRCHSSSIKPYLTGANKKTRLKWCVDMIEQGLVGDPRFKDFFDFVFIDEKWFSLSQKYEKYYLLPEEDEPHHTYLGFFRAIQAIQYKKDAKTIKDLVPAVQQAFMEYSPRKANIIFVTLSVLKEAIKVKGCNNIKIPHMQKEKLEREDWLPLQISCEASLLAEAIASLPAN